MNNRIICIKYDIQLLGDFSGPILINITYYTQQVNISSDTTTPHSTKKHVNMMVMCENVTQIVIYLCDGLLN